MTTHTPTAAGDPAPAVPDAVRELLAERFGAPVREWRGDNCGPSQPAALRLIHETPTRFEESA